MSNHLKTYDIVQVLRVWSPDEWAIFYILFALIVGFSIGRYRLSHNRSYQNRSEAFLSRVMLMHFHHPDYHLINHVTLRFNNGTTQIDHILVSRFGVFVIETKDYKGWLFANATQAKWTQVIFNLKFRFQNPIIQNHRHVLAVRNHLDFLPPETVKSIVVFAGEAEFKTEIPQGVFSVPGLVDYLENQTTEAMSMNRMQFCVGRLETARLAISGKTDVEHIQNLERWHGRQI